MSTPPLTAARGRLLRYGKTCSRMHTASDSAHSSLRPDARMSKSNLLRLEIIYQVTPGTWVVAKRYPAWWATNGRRRSSACRTVPS